MSFRKILIAVDESVFAAHAADVGIDLAKSLKAEIAFIHVVDRSTALTHPEIGVSSEKLIATAELEGENVLAAFRERTGTSPRALEFIEIGKPAPAIVQCARDWPADLIVIGRRGCGTVERVAPAGPAAGQDKLSTNEHSQSDELDLPNRLQPGAVAQGVIDHAHCPVMVVRAE